MVNIILTLLTALCAGLASFISTTGTLRDRRFSGIEQIRPIGRQVIFFSALVILLTGIQGYLNEKANQEKERKAQKEQKSKDSLQTIIYQSSLVAMKSKFDSTNLKTILAVTNTLGAYGYKFDSANTKLVKIIRDSSKTKVFLADAPALAPCGDIGLATTDGRTIYMSLCSYGNGSTGFKVSYEIVAEDVFEILHYLGNTPMLSDNDVIYKDGGAKHAFILKESTNSYKEIYVRFFGTYQDLNRTHIYRMDQIAHINVKNKTYQGTLTNDGRESIDEYSKMARPMRKGLKMDIIRPGF